MRFVVACLSLVLSAGLLSASPAAAETAEPADQAAIGTSTAVFNYPVDGQSDPAITNALLGVLDAAQPGQTVRLSYYMVTATNPVIDALLRASARGVAVQGVFDSGDLQSSTNDANLDAAVGMLQQVLGSDPAAPSFAIQCPNACISKDPSSINHNKFAVVTGPDPATSVVFQSSGNLRADGSGDAAWNNAVITTGNQGLTEEYVGYFQDLATQLTVPDNDYAAHRPPVQYGTATAHFFPRTDGTDPVATWLQGVDCSTQPTRVRVAAAYFTRVKVRTALTDLAAAGCTVQVLARQDTITPEFCQQLNPDAVQIKIARAPAAGVTTLHSKYFLVDGAIGQATDQHLVWTGSHNLTRNALRRNDETFVLQSDPAVAVAFDQNWNTLWESPMLVPGCDLAGAENAAAVEDDADTETTPEYPPAPPPALPVAQSVSRGLPVKVRHNTPLRPKQTREGMTLRTKITCRVPGKKLGTSWRCRVRPDAKGTLRVQLGGKLPLRKIRVVQTARGTDLLLPFRREASYLKVLPPQARR